ncbi:hypothetical protein H5410_004899 [Solanum commersonii]|uniref:Uncharacterized protein n=1 Tax=Solanum commersonii TaxID=4109 RepID=A0A9J6A550_SOLCO|nr:hypothetical protein H5410_004899 [Solanum commersonii]
MLNDSVIRPFSSSSPFVLWLQHLCILDHWEVYFCFAKLIEEMSIAPFIAFFIFLHRGFAYWNNSRSASLRLQLLCSFQPFYSYLCLSVHSSTKTTNT